MSNATFVLITHCEDRPGISSSITTAIFEVGGNIVDAQQFNDTLALQFFSRTVFTLASERQSQLRDRLALVLNRLNASWSMNDQARRQKVLILASRSDHCVGELIYRWKSGELNMEIVGIASNYEESTYRNVFTFPKLPFYHLPVTHETKSKQEAELLRLIEETEADLVILARYMQILSKPVTDVLAGRCINIHHSFLPGFKGARPYHQAHERGVKLIGATAHYVTGELDEGPIIEQEVLRISHHDRPEDLVRKGREIERRVLARAVKYHLEDRIILQDHKTVVFSD